WRKSVTPGPGGAVERELEAALWRLLAVSGRDDGETFLRRLDEGEDAFATSTEPRWIAWRHALAARRAVVEGDPDAAESAVNAGREVIEKCDRSGSTALTLAYLAQIEVAA